MIYHAAFLCVLNNKYFICSWFSASAMSAGLSQEVFLLVLPSLLMWRLSWAEQTQPSWVEQTTQFIGQ